MAEVSEQAKEAKVEYDKAEKVYKEMVESARDVNHDKASANKRIHDALLVYKDAKKISDDFSKAASEARKYLKENPDDEDAKENHKNLKEKRDEAKGS